MRWILLATLTLAAAPSPAAAAKVKVHGRSVHYTVRGSGRTIIFVHGWTCDGTSWSRQIPAFAGKYRVVTLDLPGHGKSEMPEQNDFSMSRFAEAVEAVRAAVHADRVVLVGHSMGVGVIRRYALRYPEHLAGLVAVDGPLDIRPYTNWRPSPTPLTMEGRARLIETMFVPATPEHLRARVRKMMLDTPEVTAAGASGSMFNPSNQSDEIILAPALTIYAGKPVFPVDPDTKQMLPDWEARQISGSGHFVMLEKAKQFNRLLASFLSRRARFKAATQP